jgi:uracil-DNA glycosylase family 4
MVIMMLEADKNCSLCERLCLYRAENKHDYPSYFNAPVPSFLPEETLDGVKMVIVGLAPGLHGANKTGRPFTGDYAGILLYNTLLKFDFAEGDYKENINDGLELKNCMVTNAVKCVPPQNKPILQEINQCNQFLKATLAACSALKVIISLGHIAHNAVLDAYGLKKSKFVFAHSAEHNLSQKVVMVNSYHCSRYNTNTKRLTEDMFEDVFEKAKTYIAESNYK